MKIVKEFKSFISRGNVVDLAVGIIIGAAFTSVVNSLVKDVMMPVVGQMGSNVDFSNLFINLSDTHYATLAEAEAAGAATLNYGLFINALISFLIVAWCVFLMMKGVDSLKRKAEDPTNKAVPTPKDIQLLSEIRDLLASSASGGAKKATSSKK